MAAGRPRECRMREIINGIFYVTRAGCPWRLLPNDLPPWGTIYRWFAVWRDDGCFERINHALVMADPERVGRDTSPTAAIIDSQSARTTDAGGAPGYPSGTIGQATQRLRTRLPLRRIRYAARASDRSCFMTFETDSKGREADVTELLATRDQTGGSVGLFRQTIAPKSGPPIHIHQTEDEFFYVVKGE